MPSNERGMTLIELLAAITITAMIIGIITSISFVAGRSMQTIPQRESVQEAARLLTEHMTDQIRSQSITAATDQEGYFLELRRNNTARELAARYLYNEEQQTVTIEHYQDGQMTAYELQAKISSVSATLEENNKLIRLFISAEVPFNRDYSYSTTVRIPSWNE